MTRINTNVSSLTAQKTLARSNVQLQQALTRLSTGLRINFGKDDPAGLIASEVLRSDITSTQKAITNSERASQMIATADSALGQVTGLLNDIRGLVTEAANTGVLSDEQIAANQLQVDSSLEALNRIAQTTTFQGRRLLDGSLDFNITAGTNYSAVTDLQINQASLGSAGSIAVSVDITTAATQAKITDAAAPYTKANATLSFASGVRFTTDGGDGGTAVVDIFATDAAYAGKTIDINAGDLNAFGSAAKAVYAAGTLTITVHDGTGPMVQATDADVVAAVNGVTGFGADTVTAGNFSKSETPADMTMSAATLKVEGTLAGGPTYNNMKISVATQAALGAANPTAVYTAASNTLVLTIDDDEVTALSTLETKIEALAQGFIATVTSAGNSRAGIAGVSTLDVATTGDTAYTGGGVLLDDLTFQLSGKLGTEVFTFEQYTVISQMASAVNLVSDATGVTASNSSGTLTFLSSAYGSDAIVGIEVISEGAAGTFEGLLSAPRATGTNIVASVNGYTADGDGNTLSINTSTLSMAMTVTNGYSSDITFTIAGGGALFQLGPDVVSNQQARMGIESVNSASLGGETGRLYQLGSGGSAALATDSTTAARIVDEVIDKVTSLRGRLGAFQRTTLDTNVKSLTDTLENLTGAESAIRDADFAAESANLTRAQILVQSGTSVLAIANQNPQNVLALLR